MKINVQNLKDGTHVFDFCVERGELDELDLGQHEIYRAPIFVESTVDKRGLNIVVTSRVRTVGDFECDVCLSHFAREVEDEFRVLYTYESALVEADHDEMVQLLSGNSHEIDLRFGVRDSLLLAVPIKVKCSEECKGLCPHCGANLNEGACACERAEIDPRWEQLRKLASV